MFVWKNFLPIITLEIHFLGVMEGEQKFKKWFFLKTVWPISINKIYVLDTNEGFPKKNKKNLFENNCS